MDRAALLIMLEDEFAPLAAEAGIPLTDTADGAGPSLDRVQGIADTYPTLAEHWLAEVARYYLLDRIVKRLAANMNVSVSGDSYSLRQIFENAKVLRDELRGRVGFIIDGMPTLTDADTATGKDVVVVTPFLTGTDYYEGEF